MLEALEYDNHVLLCGYLIITDKVTYISSVVGKNQSHNNDKDFLVQIKYSNECNHSEFKSGTKVSAVGYITNDGKANQVMITNIKKGFKSLQHIVLFKGVIKGYKLDTYYSYNLTHPLLGDMWYIRLTPPNHNENTLIIYFPHDEKVRMRLENYNIEKGESIALIGKLWHTNRHFSTEYKFTENNISLTQHNHTLCPFVISGHYNINSQAFNEKYSKYCQLINNVESQSIDTKHTKSKKMTTLDVIEQMISLKKKYHMFYRNQDIFNFCYSMSDGTLTILAGLSGVGKTNLVKLYAEALGVYNHQQFKHIAVSPNWTSTNDLLGFYNPNNSKYYPSRTGLVDLLRRAANDPDHFYIVLLDEMNLSRVEYYFSELLSRLEYPSDDPNRCVNLFDARAVSSDHINMVNGVTYSANNYPSYVHIYDNVLFVGTINNDISTKNITDKVLDRSDYITLPTFSVIFKKNPQAFVNHFTIFENDQNIKGLTQDELVLLYKLDQQLHTSVYQFGIGWRILKQMNKALSRLPTYDELSDVFKSTFNNSDEYEKTEFDYQLFQRIVSKIVNNSQLPFKAISHINNILKYYFGDYKDMAKSVQMMTRKIEALKSYGYGE